MKKRIMLSIGLLVVLLGSCDKNDTPNVVNVKEYEALFKQDKDIPSTPDNNSGGNSGDNSGGHSGGDTGGNSGGGSTETPKAMSSFEKYLISADFDKNKNGAIDPDEVVNIANLNVSGKGLKDLDGIEKFTNLEILDASNNDISSVSLSNGVLVNINISNNKLTKLDVSQCKYLSGGHGKLDVTGNTTLSCIRVSNDQLGATKIFSANWKKDAKTEFTIKCN